MHTHKIYIKNKLGK